MYQLIVISEVNQQLTNAQLESPDLPSFLKLTETDVEHQVQTLVTRESDIRRLVEMGKNTIEPKSTEVTAKSSPTTGSVVSAASPASVCKFFLPVKGRQATPFPTNSVASGSLASSIRSPAPSTPKAIHQQNPMNLTVPATAPMTVTRIERPSGAFAERRGRQEQPERSNAVEGLLPSLLPQPADAHMQTETSQPVEESRRVRFAEVDQSQDKTVVPSSPSVHGTEQSPAGVKTLATESEGGPAPVTGVSGSPPIDDTAPSRGSGSASSSRPRSRASTRSRATSQLLPGPLPMIPSPLISDSLNAVINVTKRFREVTQALGFRDDDAFKVWCKRCVEWSFDEFYKPYMKDWSNYAQRLSKAEVDEATNIGCRALIALIKEDQTGFLEGHCEFDFPSPGYDAVTNRYLSVQ